jgi:hypothetical protein
MYNSLAEGEVVPGENGVPNEDGKRDDDDDTQMTKDKAPDR